jgi:hypothetical protein
MLDRLQPKGEILLQTCCRCCSRVTITQRTIVEPGRPGFPGKPNPLEWQPSHRRRQHRAGGWRVQVILARWPTPAGLGAKL